MKTKKQTKITMGLIILVVLLIGYVGFTEFNKSQLDLKESYYIEGYNIGQYDIIMKINSERTIPVLYEEDGQTKLEWVKLTNEN